MIVQKTAEELSRELEEARAAIGDLNEALTGRQREIRDLKLLLSGISDLAYICDTGGRILYVNKAFEKLTGKSVTEFTGRPFAPLFDEENLEVALDNYMRTLKGESPVYELRFKATGTLCRFKSMPMEDSDGVITGVFGTARDITGQKMAELRLAESERRFKSIFEDAYDGMLIADPETKMFHLGNKAICRELGYSEDEIKSMGVADIHPQDQLPAVMENFKKLVRGEFAMARVVPVKRKDGSVFYVNITASKVSLGGKLYSLGIFRDITELRKASAQAQRYKVGLEAIFRSVKDAIITVDTDFRVMEVNDAAEKFCGITRASIGERLDMHKYDSRCTEAVTKTMREREPVEINRVLCDKCDNPAHRRVISIHTQPLVDDRWEFSGVVLVIRDETRIADLERDLGQRERFHNFIGQSSKLQPLFSLVETLAQTQTTVLITGESGTGKELVAEAIHYTGARRDKPFVKVNCAALPEQLLESELFGHVKGAFTGAVKDRVGRFELADGGTIFLDEIGDISGGLQMRLLRVLQEREFERVGDSTTRKVDIRVIAATHRNLAEKVRRANFREDLYYRLKVIELAIPPLRERIEDLPFLMEHFIERFNAKYSKEIMGVSEDARSVLMSYPWPGNVRELEHALEHAFILCNGQYITAPDLPAMFHKGGRPRPRGQFAAKDEREEILTALEKTAWNKARAARLLGISRRTIYRKMELHSITGQPTA